MYDVHISDMHICVCVCINILFIEGYFFALEFLIFMQSNVIPPPLPYFVFCFYLFKAEIRKLWLIAQIFLSFVFVNKVYWNIAMLLHLHIVYGFFRITVVELNCSNIDHMACKDENIHSLVLSRKSLLTLALKYFFILWWLLTYTFF